MLEIPSTFLSKSPSTIVLDAANYLRVIQGKLIIIPPEAAKLAGVTFQLVNKRTGTYMYRDLHSFVIDGDGNYWGYWVKYICNN